MHKSAKLSKQTYVFAGLATLFVFAVAAYLYFGIGMDRVDNWLADQNLVLLLVLMAVLPLFGFSIGLIYVVAGARFDEKATLVVVPLIAFHLIATYAITRSWVRRPMERFLQRRGHHLPQPPKEAYFQFTLLG